MPTLRSILCDRFGYVASDFSASDGAIWVDSKLGTICPVDSTDPALVVQLSAIIHIGDEITLAPHPNSSNKVRFTILAINKDGVSALFANGSIGFLPWAVLSYGISNPSTVEIDSHMLQPRSEPADDVDLVKAELRHLEEKLNERYDEIRAILARIEVLTTRLQEPSLDRPSTWLSEI